MPPGWLCLVSTRLAAPARLPVMPGRAMMPGSMVVRGPLAMIGEIPSYGEVFVHYDPHDPPRRSNLPQ
jgi:hypothetical protein